MVAITMADDHDRRGAPLASQQNAAADQQSAEPAAYSNHRFTTTGTANG